MSTITMPNAIEGAIKTMCEETVAQVVAILATKHGFDGEAAMRDLKLDDLKIVRKSGSSPRATKSKPADSGDKPKTKRGPTGYLLYANSTRPETRAEMGAALEEGTKLKPQDVMREIATRWKALSDEERAEWVAKAKSPPPSDDEAKSKSSSDDEAKPEMAAVAMAVAKPEPEPEAEPEAKPKPKSKSKSKSKANESPETARYLEFAQILKPTIKAEMEATLKSGEKIHPPDLVAEIARRWKGLTAEEQTTVEGAVASSGRNQAIAAEVEAVRAAAEKAKDVEEDEDELSGSDDDEKDHEK